MFRAQSGSIGTASAWLPDTPSIGFAVPGTLVSETPARGARIVHVLTLDGAVHEALQSGTNEEGVKIDSLFVYGTLLPGESRHALLGRIRSCRRATVRGVLMDCGTYPALVLASPDSGPVHGAIVRLHDPEQLRNLDDVEGFSGFGLSGQLFRRTLIQASTPDSVPIAWVYAGESGTVAGARPIPGGDWLAYRLTEKQEN